MIFWQHWQRERGGLLGWAAAVVALVAPSVAFFEVLITSDSMQELARVVEQMPPALQALFGGSLNFTDLNGWLQLQVFSMLVPLLLGLHAALGAMAVVTRDLDAGTMEYVLALPVSRSRVVLSRLGALIVNSAMLHLLALGAIALGAALISRQPDYGRAALVLLNSWLACGAVAALLLLVSVFVHDYQRGQFIASGLGLALFFVPAAIEPGTSLEAVRGLSVFAYYRPAEVMTSGAIAWGDAAVLAGAAVVLGGAALWLFGRRELPA